MQRAEKSIRVNAPAKKVYEFALVVQPLKLKGFTGSTVAPTAFR